MERRLRGERTCEIWKVLSEKSCGYQRKVDMWWFMQQWGLMRGRACKRCAAWGGSVPTLRWIRRICIFAHSPTQQCLRLWPLGSPSLSQTGVGDTDTGAHTEPSAHTLGRGTRGAVWSSLHLRGWLHSRILPRSVPQKGKDGSEVPA